MEISSVKLISFPFYSLLFQAWTRQTARRFKQVLKQSRLMVGVISLSVMVYWGFFTWLFYRGILFLQGSIPALGDLLVARMFYVLFAFIFVMLVTSSVVVGYGVFFQNRETSWLQTLPVPHHWLFHWKFMEMSILASWAFVFLSGPILLAYGMTSRLSPLFLVGSAALYLPFSLLANALGGAATLWLVWLWHTVWGRRGILAGACVGLGLAYHFFKPIDVLSLRETEFLPLLNLMLQNTRLVVSPLLPSYWLATAVIGLADRLWWKTFFFFTVMLSYALLAGWLILRHGGGLFHKDSSVVQDRRLHGRTHSLRVRLSPLFWSGWLCVVWMRWLALPVRSLLRKDWIAFWRDTAQWSQFAIFFGLLGFYFINIRNFRFQLDDRFWVSAVAFLNLASLGLILATLTTRFVFPQFSLEGRRIWLVGLAPVSMAEVIWGKFWASAFVSGGITVSLMLFSFSSLQLDWTLRWLIGFTVVMMSLGLSGIAVGTGVLFPNLKQHNAAQIVSGFGGTFCLVLSLAYVAVTVVMVSFPGHLRYVARLPLDFRFTSSASLMYIGVFLIGFIAAWLPMWLAQKKLARFEI